MARSKSHTSAYNDNVFINCPFDEDYKPLFDAIVFAIHDMGFVARCAREVIDSGETRLKKILRIITDCRYGIHDISRTELGATSLPRFNMPFECGLFWGCREFGGDVHRGKQMLILDREAFRYQQSLSDIAGQDIESHEGDPRKAIDKIRTWLKVCSRRKNIPGGSMIWDHFELFQEQLPHVLDKAQLTMDEISRPGYYLDYVDLVVQWLQQREALAKS